VASFLLVPFLFFKAEAKAAEERAAFKQWKQFWECKSSIDGKSQASI